MNRPTRMESAELSSMVSVVLTSVFIAANHFYVLGPPALLLGGGMANHFVRAIGLPVGRSLLEEDKVAVAREVLDLCKKEGKTIALPSDFVVAASVDDAKGARTVGISKIPEDAMALDVGQKTLEQFERLLEPAKTCFENFGLTMMESTGMSGRLPLLLLHVDDAQFAVQVTWKT